MSTFQTYRESDRPKDIASAPGSRGWRWPAVVVGLLLLNVGVCAVTVVSAVGSAAYVEPGYYAKAVDWDDAQRAWPDAARAGFQIDVSPLRAGTGQTLVGARLRDADGSPVRGAHVVVEWFAVIEPATRERVVMDEASALPGWDGGDGWYIASPEPYSPGVWKATVQVTVNQPGQGGDTERRAKADATLTLE